MKRGYTLYVEACLAENEEPVDQSTYARYRSALFSRTKGYENGPPASFVRIIKRVLA